MWFAECELILFLVIATGKWSFIECWGTFTPRMEMRIAVKPWFVRVAILAVTHVALVTKWENRCFSHVKSGVLTLA